MAPAEGRTGRCEVAGCGEKIFLGVQGAIFTGGVAEQDVHDLARFAASRPEAMDEGAGTRLVLFANGALKFAEEGFPILRRDLGEMIVVGPRLPLEKVPPRRLRSNAAW